MRSKNKEGGDLSGEGEGKEREMYNPKKGCEPRFETPG